MNKVIILVALFKTISPCQDLWSNKCVKGEDCCSGFCDRPESWEFGVCKEQLAGKATCHDDWYNKCQDDSSCCSGFCDNPNKFEFGVCKPKQPSVSTGGEKSCQDINFNKCKINQDCCSGFCDKPESWEFGVCKVKLPDKAVTNTCHEDWYNKCKDNSACCSDFCDKPATFEFGVCKPNESKTQLNQSCHGNYFNKCQIDLDCCSEFCERPESWEFGVCKEPECHNDWYNKCQANSTCCSKYCDKPDKFEFGVCKPNSTGIQRDKTGNEICKPLYYNECYEDSECCSQYCDKGPRQDWKLGVCKNKTSQFNNLSGNGTCHKLWYNGCTNSTRCCSGHCYFGENTNWEYGVCKWPDLHKDKIKLAKDGDSAQCMPLWANKCQNNVDCCSGYCYKGEKGDWQFGLCKNIQMIVHYQLETNKSTTCNKHEGDSCMGNLDCCTGICDTSTKNTTGQGVCKTNEFYFIISLDDKPNAAGNIDQTARCFPLYTTGCSLDKDCCAEGEAYCDRGPDGDWKAGVCRPHSYRLFNDSAKETKVCFEDWYEYCLKDTECCSGWCYKDPTWSYGACFPNKTPRSYSTTTTKSLTRTKRSSKQKSLMVCYIGTWANYKPDKGKFTIEDIDASLCTHLVYGFAKLEKFEIAAFDPWLDLSKNETGGGLDAYARFNKLKKSGVKTIVAIGGWNEGSEKYSLMASTAASRMEFARSVLKFLQKHGFDGIDIDWEFPSTRGGQPQDQSTFSKLLSALSTTIRPHGFSLSVAVSANPRTVETGYDVPTISSLVDFISIMSYDYHGAFDDITGHNAPLFGRPDDEDKTFNVNYGVRFWLAKGAPASKLVMGFPLYGRAITLKDGNNGVGAAVRGPGEPGKYSGEPGAIYYREICEMTKNDKDWDIRWDSTSIVPYMTKGDQWITYDNTASLKYKAIYAQKLGLAGAMVWSMESDDFNDECGEGKNPLMKTIVETMNNPIDQYLEPEKPKEEEKKCPKSGIDSVPILSQLKSLFQAASGDSKCAKETQENFVRTAPIISQVTSLVQTVGGNPEEAKKTQMMFLKHLEEQVDGTPVLGHIKGGIHLGLGDKEKGEQVLKDATRPLAVVGGGIAGAVAGGPAGAVAGGVAAGAAYDGLVTGIDSAVKGKYTAYGSLDSIPKVFKGEASPGELFDTLAGVVGDGLSGLGGKGLVGGKKPAGKGGEGGKGGRILCRRRRQASGGCQWDNTFNNIPNRHNMNNVQMFNAAQVRPSPGLALVTHRDPTGRQALRQVQVNPNANNRVEYVQAHITKNNLRKGTGTNQATRDFTKLMGNNDPRFANDDAGHIIAKNLGGPGDQPNNIYPQTALLNQGDWKGIEKLVFDEVDKKGDRVFSLKLNYDDSAGLSTRPTSVVYKIEDLNGNIIHSGDIENPLIPAGMRAKDY
ncbi:hypothetical protein PPYR_15658 [Photinus pyralis]|uniref:GH18 domain-containing protein n=2 Tax=Photinus pyralis TaxID=7054 RepID=A0A5N4A0B2_PHOPY|nr:uncharacterized protein LOC116182825 [Photinus pyralis]KAB0790753.1 hypothetical protein PPYR_15658 [Photinus pyralis]